ncbi:hypothetical protein GRF61_12225 [Azoarcus sp. TTM-91]|uniref:hypothetical protein n=1 Tax=Azoarcus sp. TTM-91 TaxID=2691581 RepID=UPI00145DBFA4|nr:hypothetical protein [Azoarcus sp. TTM-91]NMG35211.1 hypothetical protein [Azoarcus sp. TTM-91]
MRATAYDFAIAIEQEIAALSREQRCLRTGRAKRLLEELYPLSRFALRCTNPGTIVEVEAYEDNGPVDGAIYRLGDHESKLSIEITFVYSYEDSLRDELLWTTGSTPGSGPIHRDKKTGKIIASLAPDPESIKRLATSIVALFKKKTSKGYPKGTLLLIAFEDPTFFGFGIWKELFSAIELLGGLNGEFGEVYIINCGSDECQFVTY